MSPRVVLVEGLPGSGKSTIARRLVDRLRVVDPDWGFAWEEQPDHPFFGRDVWQNFAQPDYDEICLDRWAELATSSIDRPWVLEACGLQMTVRFLFEHEWSTDKIWSYWRRFEDIMSPAGARVVYLRPRAVRSFLSSHTQPARRRVWATVSGYVASTPAGVRIAERGGQIPIDVWVEYSRLCDELINNSRLPSLALDVPELWDSAADHAAAWLRTSSPTV